jgi:CelD/BcsL family acetyltransferase involved in cellulose biosynthesis
MNVPVYRLSPVEDLRWGAFVQRHPDASVFHTPEWLSALRRTYGYEPFALTNSAPGEDLTNGLVFCRVRSWLTGERLVSLPFSDHCQPLVADDEELLNLVSALEEEQDARKWTYIEIRSTDQMGQTLAHFATAQSFCFHVLDLRPSEEDLFKSFHKDCVQRKVRRAEREGVEYESGRSERLLQIFYELLLLTRRRQRLPPQPLKWFQNVIACMGEKATVRVASKCGRPVASVLTLRHRDTLTYKYSGSDRAFSSLGGTQLVLWKAIQEAKHVGLSTFDLGRSNWDDRGLINFKERWGAMQSKLLYLRPATRRTSQLPGHLWWLKAAAAGTRIGGQILSVAPRGMVTSAVRLLYRHFGCI